MNISFDTSRLWMAGLYAWLSTLFFGAILSDVVYANLLWETTEAFNPSSVFVEVADALLCIMIIVITAAIVAIFMVWKSTAARNLFIASLFCLSIEFSSSFFISMFLQNTEMTSIGPWLRLIPSGAASFLAMTGLVKYCQQRERLFDGR